MKNQRIVLFAPGHIGDFIWLTSIFSILRAYEPHAELILIASKSCSSLVDKNFDIKYKFFIRDDFFSHKNTYIRYLYKLIFISNFKLFFKLFKADILFLFSTPPGFYILLFNKIHRIKNIVYGRFLISGASIKEKYLKYCSKVVNFQNLKDMHIMLKFQFIVKDYFKTYNLSIPKLPDTNCLSDKIKNLIGKTKKYKIALCTRGAADWKFLDITFLKDLILKINNSFDAIFFITGAGNIDFDDTKKLQDLLPNIDIRSMYNKTTLLELVEFMRNMDLLISIDTGVVHISAAVNTPVISLCGPTLPIHSAPISYKGITLYSGRTCSPCDTKINGENIICKDMKCLKDISSDMLVEEVRKILN